MFIIPFNTDAPLYYRPWGTVLLIVINVVVGLVLPQTMGTDLGLHYGHGFTPLQWFTSLFIHADIFHLLGNMFFLWGFGLIIEGKLGWQRFLPLYLLMGGLESGLEQLLFWNETGVSLGASSVIFGLLAISLVWAPRNELSVFYWLILRGGIAEVSVLWFSGLLLLKSVLICSFTGVTPTTELLHLLGALFGLLIGFLFLTQRWVDCEGWDLLSVLRGQRPQSPLLREPLVEKKISKRKRPNKEEKGPSSGSPDKFVRLISQRKPLAALNELRQIRGLQPLWQPQPTATLALARALRKQCDWPQSLAFYKEYLIQCPAADDIVRFEIAEILILVVEHPQAALTVLKPIDATRLSGKLAEKLNQLRQRAVSMIDEGTLELQDDGWTDNEKA